MCFRRSGWSCTAGLLWGSITKGGEAKMVLPKKGKHLTRVHKITREVLIRSVANTISDAVRDFWIWLTD